MSLTQSRTNAATLPASGRSSATWGCRPTRRRPPSGWSWPPAAEGWPCGPTAAPSIGPAPADGEFFALVDNFEGLLDRLLKRFEDRYANVYTRLDELLKVKQPGRSHAGQLREGFPHNYVTLRYFFDRATPEWLVPLRDAGFFGSPPEPVLRDDARTLDVPPWPQSLYLLRVAGDLPGEVLDTAVSIPPTGNVIVNGNLTELATRFPAGVAARLVPRVIASLDARFGVLDPLGFGRLCRHLADGGRPADALALMEALLTRLPGSRQSRSVMDTWSFAEVLRTSVPLSPARPGCQPCRCWHGSSTRPSPRRPPPA